MVIENPNRDEIKDILQRSKRIAVVGLSDNPDRESFGVSKAMQKKGYEIIPVNPTVDEVLGKKAVDSIEDVKDHIDIVNVFRKSEFLPDLAKQTVAVGADVFWAQLGVFNEEAYHYLKDHGIIVVMDRCIKVEHSLTKA